MIPAAELWESEFEWQFAGYPDQRWINPKAQLRVSVFYSGRVQGVGFRYTVKRLVCGFDVSGTVENLADGRVKLVAEGEEGELKEFLEAIGDAGLAPMIRDQQVSWSDSTGEFKGFDIVR